MSNSAIDTTDIAKLAIPPVETENIDKADQEPLLPPPPAPSADDEFPDVSVYDSLNGKRSPKQDRSSKRVLRKSTIRLASTNQGLVTEITVQVEEEKQKEEQSKIEKSGKKKSFKNLFGLLSFNSKAKTNDNKTTSTPNTATCDNGERSSADGTSNSTSFSTDTNPTTQPNPTATDHVTNPIKRESLQSPAKSETETVLSEDNKANSPISNRKGTFNKIRTKSLHRVVSVRHSSEQEKQTNTNSLTTVDTSSYDDISRTVSSPTTPINNNPTPPGASSAFQLFASVDDEQPQVNEETVERFSPTNEQSFPATVNQVDKDDVNIANVPPRRSSYEIVDQKGRKRSISSFTYNAPIPPPPPPQKDEEVEAPRVVVVQAANGRRVSITALSPNAPIVPPPPLPPKSTHIAATEEEEEM